MRYEMMLYNTVPPIQYLSLSRSDNLSRVSTFPMGGKRAHQTKNALTPITTAMAE